MASSQHQLSQYMSQPMSQSVPLGEQGFHTQPMSQGFSTQPVVQQPLSQGYSSQPMSQPMSQQLPQPTPPVVHQNQQLLQMRQQQQLQQLQQRQQARVLASQQQALQQNQQRMQMAAQQQVNQGQVQHQSLPRSNRILRSNSIPPGTPGRQLARQVTPMTPQQMQHAMAQRQQGIPQQVGHLGSIQQRQIMAQQPGTPQRLSQQQQLILQNRLQQQQMQQQQILQNRVQQMPMQTQRIPSQQVQQQNQVPGLQGLLTPGTPKTPQQHAVLQQQFQQNNNIATNNSNLQSRSRPGSVPGTPTQGASNSRQVNAMVLGQLLSARKLSMSQPSSQTEAADAPASAPAPGPSASQPTQGHSKSSEAGGGTTTVHPEPETQLPRSNDDTNSSPVHNSVPKHVSSAPELRLSQDSEGGGAPNINLSQDAMSSNATTVLDSSHNVGKSNSAGENNADTNTAKNADKFNAASQEGNKETNGEVAKTIAQLSQPSVPPTTLPRPQSLQLPTLSQGADFSQGAEFSQPADLSQPQSLSQPLDTNNVQFSQEALNNALLSGLNTGIAAVGSRGLSNRNSLTHSNGNTPLSGTTPLASQQQFQNFQPPSRFSNPIGLSSQSHHLNINNPGTLPAVIRDVTRNVLQKQQTPTTLSLAPSASQTLRDQQDLSARQALVLVDPTHNVAASSNSQALGRPNGQARGHRGASPFYTTLQRHMKIGGKVKHESRLTYGAVEFHAVFDAVEDRHYFMCAHCDSNNLYCSADEGISLHGQNCVGRLREIRSREWVLKEKKERAEKQREKEREREIQMKAKVESTSSESVGSKDHSAAKQETSLKCEVSERERLSKHGGIVGQLREKTLSGGASSDNKIKSHQVPQGMKTRGERQREEEEEEEDAERKNLKKAARRKAKTVPLIDLESSEEGDVKGAESAAGLDSAEKKSKATKADQKKFENSSTTPKCEIKADHTSDKAGSGKGEDADDHAEGDDEGVGMSIVSLMTKGVGSSSAIDNPELCDQLVLHETGGDSATDSLPENDSSNALVLEDGHANSTERLNSMDLLPLEDALSKDDLIRRNAVENVDEKAMEVARRKLAEEFRKNELDSNTASNAGGNAGASTAKLNGNTVNDTEPENEFNKTHTNNSKNSLDASLLQLLKNDPELEDLVCRRMAQQISKRQEEEQRTKEREYKLLTDKERYALENASELREKENARIAARIFKKAGGMAVAGGFETIDATESEKEHQNDSRDDASEPDRKKAKKKKKKKEKKIRGAAEDEIERYNLNHDVAIHAPAPVNSTFINRSNKTKRNPVSLTQETPTAETTAETQQTLAGAAHPSRYDRPSLGSASNRSRRNEDDYERDDSDNQGSSSSGECDLSDSDQDPEMINSDPIVGPAPTRFCTVLCSRSGVEVPGVITGKNKKNKSKSDKRERKSERRERKARKSKRKNAKKSKRGRKKSRQAKRGDLTEDDRRKRAALFDGESCPSDDGNIKDIENSALGTDSGLDNANDSGSESDNLGGEIVAVEEVDGYDKYDGVDASDSSMWQFGSAAGREKLRTHFLDPKTIANLDENEMSKKSDPKSKHKDTSGFANGISSLLAKGKKPTMTLPENMSGNIPLGSARSFLGSSFGSVDPNLMPSVLPIMPEEGLSTEECLAMMEDEDELDGSVCPDLEDVYASQRASQEFGGPIVLKQEQDALMIEQSEMGEGVLDERGRESNDNTISGNQVQAESTHADSRKGQSDRENTEKCEREREQAEARERERERKKQEKMDREEREKQEKKERKEAEIRAKKEEKEKEKQEKLAEQRRQKEEKIQRLLREKQEKREKQEQERRERAEKKERERVERERVKAEKERAKVEKERAKEEKEKEKKKKGTQKVKLEIQNKDDEEKRIEKETMEKERIEKESKEAERPAEENRKTEKKQKNEKNLNKKRAVSVKREPKTAQEAGKILQPERPVQPEFVTAKLVDHLATGAVIEFGTRCFKRQKKKRRRESSEKSVTKNPSETINSSQNPLEGKRTREVEGTRHDDRSQKRRKLDYGGAAPSDDYHSEDHVTPVRTCLGAENPRKGSHVKTSTGTLNLAHRTPDMISSDKSTRASRGSERLGFMSGHTNVSSTISTGSLKFGNSDQGYNQKTKNGFNHSNGDTNSNSFGSRELPNHEEFSPLKPHQLTLSPLPEQAVVLWNQSGRKITVCADELEPSSSCRSRNSLNNSLNTNGRQDRGDAMAQSNRWHSGGRDGGNLNCNGIIGIRDTHRNRYDNARYSASANQFDYNSNHTLSQRGSTAGAGFLQNDSFHEESSFYEDEHSFSAENHVFSQDQYSFQGSHGGMQEDTFQEGHESFCEDNVNDCDSFECENFPVGVERFPDETFSDRNYPVDNETDDHEIYSDEEPSFHDEPHDDLSFQSENEASFQNDSFEMDSADQDQLFPNDNQENPMSQEDEVFSRSGDLGSRDVNLREDSVRPEESENDFSVEAREEVVADQVEMDEIGEVDVDSGLSADQAEMDEIGEVDVDSSLSADQAEMDEIGEVDVDSGLSADQAEMDEIGEVDVDSGLSQKESNHRRQDHRNGRSRSRRKRSGSRKKDSRKGRKRSHRERKEGKEGTRKERKEKSRKERKEKSRRERSEGQKQESSAEKSSRSKQTRSSRRHKKSGSSRRHKKSRSSRRHKHKSESSTAKAVSSQKVRKSSRDEKRRSNRDHKKSKSSRSHEKSKSSRSHEKVKSSRDEKTHSSSKNLTHSSKESRRKDNDPNGPNPEADDDTKSQAESKPLGEREKSQEDSEQERPQEEKLLNDASTLGVGGKTVKKRSSQKDKKRASERKPKTADTVASSTNPLPRNPDAKSAASKESKRNSKETIPTILEKSFKTTTTPVKSEPALTSSVASVSKSNVVPANNNLRPNMNDLRPNMNNLPPKNINHRPPNTNSRSSYGATTLLDRVQATVNKAVRSKGMNLLLAKVTWPKVHVKKER